ncbi:uncharacterized protein LOC129592457 [Paramacrobiotus metropolitanus]|uniref:uncharacterized protein LOC129592457 n=1 Tax=Paramacrobiotus metropolitanus TaxID=2943436 RepID=UPI0024460114|nr:uncharacterized protein LOC129592457 [Paramacrobiotus metropolitanus]
MPRGGGGGGGGGRSRGYGARGNGSFMTAYLKLRAVNKERVATRQERAKKSTTSETNDDFHPRSAPSQQNQPRTGQAAKADGCQREMQQFAECLQKYKLGTDQCTALSQLLQQCRIRNGIRA